MTNKLIKLDAIGYWRSESSVICGSPSDLPNPKDLVCETPDWMNSIAPVLKYLTNGRVFVSWRGPSYCRICNDISLKMGTRCLTDSKWVWPEGLAHYVRQHSIQLPQEFLDHMAQNDWKLVEVDTEFERSREIQIHYDFNFWLDWATENSKKN